MPKALANSSPGFERSENPGWAVKEAGSTLKGLFPHRPNAFSVGASFVFAPLIIRSEGTTVAAPPPDVRRGSAPPVQPP